MRREQAEAEDKSLAYFRSIWAENPAAVGVAPNPEAAPPVLGSLIGPNVYRPSMIVDVQVNQMDA